MIFSESLGEGPKIATELAEVSKTATSHSGGMTVVFLSLSRFLGFLDSHRDAQIWHQNGTKTRSVEAVLKGFRGCKGNRISET